MEIVAVCFGFGFLVFLVFYIGINDFITARKIFGALLITQLFWFPAILPTKIETNDYITISYQNINQNIKFNELVRIIETRTYKPFSIFYNNTDVQIFTDLNK